MNLRPFSLHFSLLVGAFSLAVTASAQDQTINGNLFVNSALDVNGNTASFGTNGLNPGYTQIYTNNALATVDFSASASTVNWTWYQATKPQLKLDSTNKLTIYSPTLTPTTAQIVLNPAGLSTFAQGLTVSGASTFALGLTVTGTLTTGTLTTTSGITGAATITGNSTSGMNITAGASNKSITLTTTGTGSVRVTSTTASTNSTTGALTVPGGVGIGGKLNAAGDVSIGTSASTARLTVAGVGTTSATSSANFTDSAAKSLLFVRNDGNIGIGTSTPQGRLDIFNSTNAATAPLLSLRSDFAASGRYGMIRFGDQAQTSNNQKGAIIYESVATSARGKLHLALENTDGVGSVALSDAKLTVQSDGNVGIGTPYPTTKLDVVGNAKVSGNLTVQSLNVATVMRVPESGDLSMGSFVAGTSP